MSRALVAATRSFLHSVERTTTEIVETLHLADSKATSSLFMNKELSEGLRRNNGLDMRKVLSSLPEKMGYHTAPRKGVDMTPGEFSKSAKEVIETPLVKEFLLHHKIVYVSPPHAIEDVGDYKPMLVYGKDLGKESIYSSLSWQLRVLDNEVNCFSGSNALSSKWTEKEKEELRKTAEGRMLEKLGITQKTEGRGVAGKD